MEIDVVQFEEMRRRQEQLYNSVGEVHCPVLQSNVAFNAKGIDHLKTKSWNRTRLIQDQYQRFKYLYLAPEIVRKSHTLQDYYETKRFERQKINSRWENRMVIVRYYGFIAILEKVRIKVIIKEVEGGNKFFWSIIPFWKVRKENNRTQKVFHEGDPEGL